MPQILHILATLLVVPYAILAVGFLIIGKVASSRGPLNLLQSLIDIFALLVPWGAIAFFLAFLCIVSLPFFQVTRPVSPAALVVVAGFSLAILLFYRPSLPSGGELLFMLPCCAVLVASGWRILSRN
jgi:hypothetical protein